jgi:hypothetical protein
VENLRLLLARISDMSSQTVLLHATASIMTHIIT